MPTTVAINGGRIQLQTHFNNKELAKKISSCRWNKELKVWEYDATPTIAKQISDSFGGLLATDEAFTELLSQFLNIKQAAYAKDAQNLPDIPMVKTRPWLHQKQAFWFAYDMPASMLAMEMGTGKSKVVIDLIVNRKHKKTLIICPLSVVKNVWPKQFRAHSPVDLMVVPLFEGTVAQKAREAVRALRFADMGRQVVIITNYESVWRPPFGPSYDEHNELESWGFAMSVNWDFMVCDESHRIKDPGGRQSSFIAKLAEKGRYRMCLTGTPMPHSPLDVYGQYRFLDRGVYGSSFARFKQRYAEVGIFNEVKRFQNEEELNEKFYMIAYRATKDVLQLPPILSEIRTCPLSKKSAKIYQDLYKKFVADVGDGQVTVHNALVRLLRLQQVASGFVNTDEKKMVPVGMEKAELFGEVLDSLSLKEPVVTFCVFHHDLDLIREVAEQSGRKVAELSGRIDQLKDWQDGKYDVLAVQIQAGGVGIDLTRAHYCVYYSVGFSLGNYEQSRARVHRPGQTERTVFIHLLAENTVDERVYDALAERKQIIEYVLDGIKKKK